jgi:DNA-binding response OmpR family regulator
MKQHQILSIDDEPAILQLFQAALSHRGYIVFTTTSVDEGLKIAEEKDISLVMLDVHLPNRSGFDLYQDFRRRRPVPVLFVTGDATVCSGDASLDHEIAAGNAAILLKPFDIQTLYDRIDMVLH